MQSRCIALHLITSYRPVNIRVILYPGRVYDSRVGTRMGTHMGTPITRLTLKLKKARWKTRVFWNYILIFCSFIMTMMKESIVKSINMCSSYLFTLVLGYPIKWNCTQKTLSPGGYLGIFARYTGLSTLELLGVKKPKSTISQLSKIGPSTKTKKCISALFRTLLFAWCDEISDMVYSKPIISLCPHASPMFAWSRICSCFIH